MELELHPRSRASAAVKRLAIWTWVHEYAGAQLDIARALNMNAAKVSAHYGRAVAMASEMDEQAGTVTALLRRAHRKRLARKTAATDGARPVRYHVDVEES